MYCLQPNDLGHDSKPKGIRAEDFVVSPALQAVFWSWYDQYFYSAKKTAR